MLHNHAQEFVADIDGVNGYEYFASLLDDDVILVLDLFWGSHREPGPGRPARPTR